MKKVSLLLVLIFATITVSAQESGFSTKAGRNATFARNGFWDNWFIGAGAGANFYFGDQGVKFFDRPTVAPTVQFGKWFNPYIGGRVKVTGGPLNSHIDDNNRYKFNYVNPEFNFMWNVSNYLGKYNENRVYSFIPYVGMGTAIGWDYKDQNDNKFAGNSTQRTLTMSAGIINKFRLSSRLSLDIEFSGAFLKQDFDKRQPGTNISYDGLLNGSASLVYKVGSKTDFSEALLMDQGLVDDLNNQINRLRQENARLAQRPENCPKCPEAKTIEKIVKQGGGSFVSNVVFFRIGSANIDKQQEISIFNTAKYLQENPNAKVKIVGYADKQTGTPSINEKLSEKRAKNVANALIKTYNIDSNRVTVEWKGDTVQPYAENDWNRVAIFFVE